MDGDEDRRRSVLPWPDPVRTPPRRWTVLVSWAVVVGLAGVALAIVLARM
jgi:hypothetical protein